MSHTPDAEILESELEEARNDLDVLKNQLQRVIVGHSDVIEHLITAITAGGHVLLEGVPGLGKTRMVRTLARTIQTKFHRIQFTPDLMPADIIGTEVYREQKSGEGTFTFRKGPIFANIILADEVNRATPKTQSALLEAMQSREVTAAGKSHSLDEPFFVVATQNPIEMEGTYPLPEAQKDRFFFKLLVQQSSTTELVKILDRTTGPDRPEIDDTITAERLLTIRETAREIPVPKEVSLYASRIVSATHPDAAESPESINKLIRLGASPRAAQAMIRAARVFALMDGRANVSFSDIRRTAVPALRHRLIKNFEGEAQDITPDDLVDEIIDHVPEMNDRARKLLQNI